jgi:hypothetical protein
VKPSAVARGGGRFCSRRCYELSKVGKPHPRKGVPNPERWPPVEKVCVGCGASFTTREKRLRYCNQMCAARNRPRQGPTVGLRQIMKNGYVRLTLPDGSRVYEHRWMWEQAFGPLGPGEEIHHKNEDKTDNRLKNFERLTKAEHARLHLQQRQ